MEFSDKYLTDVSNFDSSNVGFRMNYPPPSQSMDQARPSHSFPNSQSNRQEFSSRFETPSNHTFTHHKPLFSNALSFDDTLDMTEISEQDQPFVRYMEDFGNELDHTEHHSSFLPSYSPFESLRLGSLNANLDHNQNRFTTFDDDFSSTNTIDYPPSPGFNSSHFHPNYISNSTHKFHPDQWFENDQQDPDELPYTSNELIEIKEQQFLDKNIENEEQEISSEILTHSNTNIQELNSSPPNLTSSLPDPSEENLQDSLELENADNLSKSQNQGKSTKKKSKGKKNKVKLSLTEFHSQIGAENNNDLSSPNSLAKIIEEENATNVLWVGSIGRDVEEEDLEEFRQYGNARINILRDKFCAFVNYDKVEEAVVAKRNMNGRIVGSQYIQINYHRGDHKIATTSKRTVEEIPTTSNNFYKNPPSASLWIGNVSSTITKTDLENEFGKHGRVVSARLLPTKGCAFVNFMSVEDASLAMDKMQDTQLGNMMIKINYAKTKADEGSQFQNTPEITPSQLRYSNPNNNTSNTNSNNNLSSSSSSSQNIPSGQPPQSPNSPIIQSSSSSANYYPYPHPFSPSTHEENQDIQQEHEPHHQNQNQNQHQHHHHQHHQLYQLQTQGPKNEFLEESNYETDQTDTDFHYSFRIEPLSDEEQNEENTALHPHHSRREVARGVSLGRTGKQTAKTPIGSSFFASSTSSVQPISPSSPSNPTTEFPPLTGPNSSSLKQNSATRSENNNSISKNLTKNNSLPPELNEDVKIVHENLSEYSPHDHFNSPNHQINDSLSHQAQSREATQPSKKNPKTSIQPNLNPSSISQQKETPKAHHHQQQQQQQLRYRQQMRQYQFATRPTQIHNFQQSKGQNRIPSTNLTSQSPQQSHPPQQHSHQQEQPQPQTQTQTQTQTQPQPQSSQQQTVTSKHNNSEHNSEKYAQDYSSRISQNNQTSSPQLFHSRQHMYPLHRHVHPHHHMHPQQQLLLQLYSQSQHSYPQSLSGIAVQIPKNQFFSHTLHYQQPQNDQFSSKNVSQRNSSNHVSSHTSGIGNNNNSNNNGNNTLGLNSASNASINMKGIQHSNRKAYQSFQNYSNHNSNQSNDSLTLMSNQRHQYHNSTSNTNYYSNNGHYYQQHHYQSNQHHPQLQITEHNESEGVCKLCDANVQGTKFKPCGHMCCNICVAKLRFSTIHKPVQGTKCPFCSQTIQQYIALTNTNANTNTNNTSIPNNSANNNNNFGNNTNQTLSQTTPSSPTATSAVVSPPLSSLSSPNPFSYSHFPSLPSNASSAPSSSSSNPRIP